MMKRLLLFTFISCWSFNLQAQLTLSLDLDENDFGEVEVGQQVTGTLTITNTTPTMQIASLNVVDYYNSKAKVPFFDVDVNRDVCEYPNITGEGNYSGFYIVNATSGDLERYSNFNVPGRGQITYTIAFAPSSFEYELRIGEDFACVEFDPFSGECFFFEPIPLCATYAKDGVGSYEKELYLTYYPNGSNPLSSNTSKLTVTGKATETTVGLDEVKKDQLVVYPNPASDFLNVEEGELTILNYHGNPVMNTISNGQVDISGLNAGFYTVIINGKSTKLIVK